MSSIELVEVGPRDGLQNEAVHLTTAQKLEFINRALDAGVQVLKFQCSANHLNLDYVELALVGDERAEDRRHAGKVGARLFDATSAEQFTVAIDPTADGGTLRLDYTGSNTDKLYASGTLTFGTATRTNGAWWCPATRLRSRRCASSQKAPTC